MNFCLATTSCKIVETFAIKNIFSFSKTLPPPSPPFKVIPQSFKHGVVLLATLIRGGGGGKAGDRGNIIKGQMMYSISSIFATRGGGK